jgi:hypothetical protein
MGMVWVGAVIDIGWGYPLLGEPGGALCIVVDSWNMACESLEDSILPELKSSLVDSTIWTVDTAEREVKLQH